TTIRLMTGPPVAVILRCHERRSPPGAAVAAGVAEPAFRHRPSRASRSSRAGTSAPRAWAAPPLPPRTRCWGNRRALPGAASHPVRSSSAARDSSWLVLLSLPSYLAADVDLPSDSRRDQGHAVFTHH